MTLLSREELQTLYTEASPPCVSIYFPTHRAGAEIQQDPIRLKNLLREAEDRLLDNGTRKQDVEELLEPARRLLDDTRFWRHQSDGLAVFLDDDSFRRFRVPRSFDEVVVVGERFHCTPLLPLLTGDGRFHVLALSQNRVRLLEATRHSVRELDPHDIPESLTEALGYDWEQRSLQFHSGTGAPGLVATKAQTRASGGPVHGSQQRGMFHGHGAGDEDVKAEVTKFLHLVDNGVTRLLTNQNAPLVVASVDYVSAIYRDLSKHPHLMDESVEGNPDELSADDLRDRAWKIVEPTFTEEQRQAIDRFHELHGTGKAGAGVTEILPGATDGRIDTLFVSLGDPVWGHYDESARHVTVRPEPETGDEELRNRAALETLLHGGTVYALEPDDMPAEAAVAAVYRY